VLQSRVPPNPRAGPCAALFLSLVIGRDWYHEAVRTQSCLHRGAVGIWFLRVPHTGVCTAGRDGFVEYLFEPSP
jgi:hypothetical protein